VPPEEVEALLARAIAEVRGAAELAERVQTSLDLILREEQEAHGKIEEVVTALAGELRKEVRALGERLDRWHADQKQDERERQKWLRGQTASVLGAILKWGGVIITAATAAYFGSQAGG